MRVFLCGDFKFPRGDAVANRMQYIAKSLLESGIEIKIVSAGENRALDWNEGKKRFYFEDIWYENVQRRKGNALDFLLRGFHAGKILNQEDINEEDVVFVSSIWPHFTAMLKATIKHRPLPRFIFDVMEWFQPYQFSGGKLNFWYQAYNWYFEHTVLSGDKVMVISDKLQQYYQKRNKETLCLPLVLSPSDYPCHPRSSFEQINFIYPGNPGKKDDFTTMLKGIALLDDAEKQKIKFHITGVKKEILESILGDDKSLLQELEAVIEYHGWLDYEELYGLYNEMHYFLLAKKDNVVSRSNFPSKVPELMSCGVISVMNNVGDIKQYLKNDEDSIIYADCCATDCCNAIRKALTLTSYEIQNMSMKARKCAENNFDYRKWSERIRSFFCDGK